MVFLSDGRDVDYYCKNKYGIQNNYASARKITKALIYSLLVGKETGIQYAGHYRPSFRLDKTKGFNGPCMIKGSIKYHFTICWDILIHRAERC